MRFTARRAALAATGITLAMLAAACGSGSHETVEPPQLDADGNVIIDDAHRVGAMPDYNVGSQFRATEPITISVLYRVHPSYPVENDWLIWQALRDDNNVTIDRTDVQLADWGQRRSLLVASGDFPDLIPIVYPGEEASWIGGGNLLPISDYFNYMPNFQHFVKEWGVEDEVDARRDPDGKIYNVPGMRQYPNIESSFALNVDKFEAAGVDIDSIHTFDDLTDALRKVQAHGDVDYAYSDRWNTQASGPLGSALQNAAPNFGVTAGWNRNVQIWDEASGQFVPRVASDGYRNLVEWFTNLRSEGLLDPEITQEDDEAIAKFINGRSAMISSSFPEMQTALRNAAHDVGIDLNTRIILVPAGPAGNNLGGSKIGPGVALNSDVRSKPTFLATLQFVDWMFFSEEGREFAQWGVEGTTFERDANGVRHYIGDIVGAGRDAAEVTAAGGTPTPLNATFGFQDGVWMQNWGGSDSLVESVMSPEQVEWVHAMRESKDVLPVDPGAPFTEGENEHVTLIETQVQDATDAGVAQFISGIRPMSEWDDFVAEIRHLGADQIAELYNTAHARIG